MQLWCSLIERFRSPASGPWPFMPSSLSRHLTTVLAALVAALLLPGAALALDAEPGQVVVKFEQGSTAHAAQVADGRPAVLKVKSVPAALRGLRARSDVAYAVPNVLAHASATTDGFVPNDPGKDNRAGGWEDVQWNFAGPAGVNAPQAWANLIADGAPGGRGVTIAVLDTGVAYGNRPPYAMSPDFAKGQFLRGLRLRRPRPVSVRSQRPRDARRGHTRRSDQQRPRPDRPGLRRTAAAGARPRRGR